MAIQFKRGTTKAITDFQTANGKLSSGQPLINTDTGELTIATAADQSPSAGSKFIPTDPDTLNKSGVAYYDSSDKKMKIQEDLTTTSLTTTSLTTTSLEVIGGGKAVSILPRAGGGQVPAIRWGELKDATGEVIPSKLWLFPTQEGTLALLSDVQANDAWQGEPVTANMGSSELTLNTSNTNEKSGFKNLPIGAEITGILLMIDSKDGQFIYQFNFEDIHWIEPETSMGKEVIPLGEIYGNQLAVSISDLTAQYTGGTCNYTATVSTAAGTNYSYTATYKISLGVVHRGSGYNSGTY